MGITLSAATRTRRGPAESGNLMAARHHETCRGEGSLPSPQAPAIGRVAPVRNPSRPASADLVPGTARNRFASAIPTPPAANQS